MSLVNYLYGVCLIDHFVRNESVTKIICFGLLPYIRRKRNLEGTTFIDYQ